jgi:hypothetical protein
VGIPLLILYDLPYLSLFDPARYDPWVQVYTAMLLILTWAALAWQAYRAGQTYPQEEPRAVSGF